MIKVYLLTQVGMIILENGSRVLERRSLFEKRREKLLVVNRIWLVKKCLVFQYNIKSQKLNRTSK